mmetsp:Transcript_70995/g.179095  ORF Transcript_70995/g.179095 Transcript_70995/m.179095 type:complete len:205 (+) Transcript_70995:197-811(+)
MLTTTRMTRRPQKLTWRARDPMPWQATAPQSERPGFPTKLRLKQLMPMVIPQMTRRCSRRPLRKREPRHSQAKTLRNRRLRSTTILTRQTRRMRRTRLMKRRLRRQLRRLRARLLPRPSRMRSRIRQLPRNPRSQVTPASDCMAREVGELSPSRRMQSSWIASTAVLSARRPLPMLLGPQTETAGKVGESTTSNRFQVMKQKNA